MANAGERKAIRTLLSGGTRQMVSLLPSLVVYPVVARALGDHQFGAWTLIGAAGFMLILSDAGLSTAVRRAAVTDDHARARRTLGLALLTICVLLPVGVALLLTQMLDFSDVSEGLRQEAHVASYLMMVGGAFGALANPFMDFVYARGGAATVARARVIGAAGQIAFLAAGFAAHRSVIVPAIASSISTLAQLILLARAAKRLDPELPLLPRRPTDMLEARRAFGDGVAQLTINAAVVMALRIDYKVLEWAATKHALADGLDARHASEKALEMVGKYGLAGLVVDMAYSVAKQANTAIMRPLGRAEDRASTFRVGTTIFSGVIVSGMAAIAFAGQPFVALILGDKALGLEVLAVMHILGGAAMILSTYEVAGAMVMLSAASAWACAVPYVAGALVNLTVSVAFAPVAPLHGIVAVAGSTVVGNLVAAVLMGRATRRVLGWTWSELLGMFAPVVAGGVVATGIGEALEAFATSGPWASLATAVLVTAAGTLTVAGLARRKWNAQDGRA